VLFRSAVLRATYSSDLIGSTIRLVSGTKLDSGEWFDEAWRDPWVFQVPGAEPPRHRGPSRAVALTASALSGRSPANGASIRSRRHDFELGRPGMWLRMDFEKPPSTQMSWPVT